MKRLDPDQDRHLVSPDLGPNCLQRLSIDNIKVTANKERVTIIPASGYIKGYIRYIGCIEEEMSYSNRAVGHPCCQQHQ